jgi:hypothetical protein
VSSDADSYAGAADAWARAAIDEARMRLGDALLETREVVAVPGTLRFSDEDLTVAMPFTDAYEALLRAGLLGDLACVSWLEGRTLRFAFEEGP